MAQESNVVVINDRICWFVFNEDDTFRLVMVGGGEVLFSQSHTKVISFPTTLNEDYTHNEMKYKLKHLEKFMAILTTISNEFGLTFCNVQTMKNKYLSVERMTSFEI